MDAPLAFRIGREGAANIRQSITKGRDQSAIDEILGRALQSEDPNVLNQSFAQLLSTVSPERQGPAAQLLQNRAQQLQQQKQASDILARRKQAYQELGIPEGVESLPEGVQSSIIKQYTQEKKPNIIETERLKNLASSAKTVDNNIADVQRGLELVDITSTGPVKGRLADFTYLSDEQQELQGIGSRLLTTGFSVLPRISNEFESFKQGQVSIRNPPAVNRRILETQLKGFVLDKAIIDRIAEIQDQNPRISEAAALKMAEKEFKGQTDNLLREFKQSANMSAAPSDGGLSQEQINAIMFG